MRYCKKCVQPENRPKVYFNEEGVCGACLWAEEKKKIDWKKRGEELRAIADWAKGEAKRRETYDCVCGVSGGKDTTFTALYARDKLGLNCLLVNAYPEQMQGNVKVIRNEGSHDHEKHILSLKSKNID